jgi:ComF family protein
VIYVARRVQPTCCFAAHAIKIYLYLIYTSLQITAVQPNLQGDLLNWPAINKILPAHAFDHLICLAPYKAPFNHWLNQFKYHHRFELSPLFSQLLAGYWLQIKENHHIPTPDMIMPVPLHINKWQSRGYNQAHLIAKDLAKILAIDYQPSQLIRVKKTESQVGKTGAERRKNLLGAFLYRPNGNREKDTHDSFLKADIPKHVMLIDDVVTTGATVNEISRCLKAIGVEKVTVMALCLSIPNAIK